MKAPYALFKSTPARMVEVVTYTDGKKDDPPKDVWDKDLWIERGEDWYALCNKDYAHGTIRVIERSEYLRSRELG